METLNLYSRKALFGAVIAAVVLVVVIIRVANRDQGESPPTVSPSDQNMSTTTIALIEHNRKSLKLLAGSSTVAEATNKWQEYTNQEAGFSIRYPADFVNIRHRKSSFIGEGGIFLERLIAYKTIDQCNTGKDDILLTHVPDFELGLSVREGTIGEALIEVGGYSKEEGTAILSGSTNFYSDRGAVSELNIGPFSAYHQFFTHDGCGATVFFVPLNHERTLMVEEPIPLGSLGVLENVPKAFQEAQSRYSPIDRGKLIYQILSTFRLLDK